MVKYFQNNYYIYIYIYIKNTNSQLHILNVSLINKLMYKIGKTPYEKQVIVIHNLLQTLYISVFS